MESKKQKKSILNQIDSSSIRTESQNNVYMPSEAMLKKELKQAEEEIAGFEHQNIADSKDVKPTVSEYLETLPYQPDAEDNPYSVTSQMIDKELDHPEN